MTFCANTNSPIDLIRTDTEVCDNKCLYEYNYGKSSLNGFNLKTNLVFLLQNNNENHVKFNSLNYNLEGMLLFRDSVHKINGNRKSAELIIVHNEKDNPSKKLVVCILINVVNQNDGDLDYIIDKMALMAPANGDSANIRYPSFSLNNIIPTSKYFNYKGDLFYENNSSNLCYQPSNIDDSRPRDSYLHDIIVFDKVLSINTTNYNNLISLINKHTFVIQGPEDTLFGRQESNTPVFYSKNNAVLGTGIMGEDDIYIECKPTGADDDKVVQVDVDIKDEDKFKFIIDYFNRTFSFLKVNKNEILGSFIGAIIIYVILKIVKSIN